ncbi:GH1 family beta-glucosidase [Pelagibacterium lentulum]|uniref:Beta-glucosidase n=1 Tax=Pelagibacterium lentulum TaxID=2029865 RepID=A0A916RGX2_9HYPH|nr:GH1 family beta-glucosidase [Pelagibacterium lentulum]GGA56669.1 beta-glucosidase [Pelagibacterium lentulum]
MFSHKRADFGEGFVFGAATAAYQIEGGQTDGRGPSIWDSFSATPGNVQAGDTGAVACDHYRLWPQDLDLLADAGFDAYRFSFSWPRLIPEGTGTINDKGIDFYDRLIDGMLERNLKPFATLYHWDLPSALQDKGGWLNRDIANWFADYAVLVAQKFGDRLATTATINEPWCVAFLSHMLGAHAPGYRDLRAAARASHHVLYAHGSAINAMRSEGMKNLGLVLNFEVAQSASADPDDMTAALLWDGIFNRWYLDGLFKGAYPTDVLEQFGEHMPAHYLADMATVTAPIDWLGVNYYTRGLYAHDPARTVFPLRKVDGPLEKTDIGWEIFPQGLEDILTRISTDYTTIPLYVTENGMAEVEGVDDPRRVAYYDSHLASVRGAQNRGANVKGYFGWSLLDNYEWAEGYSKRFGLVHVDYQTQQRTPKQSYRAFQAMLAGNNIPTDRAGYAEMA